MHLAVGRESFLTKSFTDVKDDREAFFVLCVMDMPMDATEAHDFQPDSGRGVKITAASNLLLFKKEIKTCEVDLGKNDIMVIHRYKEMLNSQKQD